MEKNGAKRSPGEGWEPVGNKNALKYGFYTEILIEMTHKIIKKWVDFEGCFPNIMLYLATNNAKIPEVVLSKKVFSVFYSYFGDKQLFS